LWMTSKCSGSLHTHCNREGKIKNEAIIQHDPFVRSSCPKVILSCQRPAAETVPAKPSFG